MAAGGTHGTRVFRLAKGSERPYASRLPMNSNPTSGAGAASLRPFDPERPKTGLFLFTRPLDETPPIETFKDVLSIRFARGLEGDELRAFWDEAWHRHEFDLDDLFPVMVRAAWRLTRALGVAKGKLPLDGFLNELDQAEWDTPSVGVNSGAPRQSLERQLVQTPIALLPPPPPAEWSDGTKDASFYDPASDVELCTYVERMSTLSRRIGLGHRKEGRLGLAPLLELALTRAAWPTPREIIAYESVVVDDATQKFIQHGTLGARRKLQDEYGFNEEEVNSLLLLARRVMRGVRNGVDGDSDKAAMVARLEDLAARCHQALDLRAELMVYKTMAVVQGLTKTQGTEEDVDDMVDVVGEVTGEAKLLESGDSGDDLDEGDDE